jgi:hypothetical protein
MGHVRFTPKSRHVQRKRHVRRNRSCLLYPRKRTCVAPAYVCFGPKADIGGYSITSSAIAITPDGIVRPSALAVLRLMTNSNFVARRIGMSAGFSPLRMRPV